MRKIRRRWRWEPARKVLGVLAVPMRSLFQTDAVAIRMSLYVSWAMRRALMVQTIAAVTW